VQKIPLGRDLVGLHLWAFHVLLKTFVVWSIITCSQVSLVKFYSQVLQVVATVTKGQLPNTTLSDSTASRAVTIPNVHCNVGSAGWA